MSELNLFCFIVNLFIAVLMGALMPIIPLLTRKSYLFGVKIPLEEHSCPEALKLKKSYINACLAGSAAVLALIIAQYIAMPDLTLLGALYYPFLFAAVQFAAFIPNWKRALKLKENQGWKVSESAFAETKSSHSRGNLSELPWAWYILSLIIIIASIIIGFVQYPDLPDLIPTHFDINMEPDAWTEKSIWAVMMMPLINLALLATMWFTGIMIVKAKLQIDPQKPELSFTQHKIYRRRMGHSIGFLALGMVVMLMIAGFMSIFPEFKISFGLLMGIILVTMIPIIAVPIISGQGGGKIKIEAVTEKSAGNISAYDNAHLRGNDKHWKLGMFYYNPDDPAHIVEDRFGINFGFNYARLAVKIAVVLGVLALIATYVWITVLLGSL
jgi:uncharacterized membrane protein